MQMVPRSKVFNALFAGGILLCLLQVWLPGHYLTCDGPCHLYNAQIVHDLWSGKHVSVYSRFYDLVYATDPNSMTTFVLAALLYVAKGAVAEKLFLTLYLLVYLSGFVALLRKIGKGDSLWMLTCFLFVFTYALSKGFYNFSFGIAFYFWVVWSWLKFMDTKSVVIAILFFVLAGCCFFTHLLPFVIAVLTCGGLLLSYAVVAHREGGMQVSRPSLLRNGAALLLLVAPYILLTLLFTRGEGGLQLQLGWYPYRLLELAEFKYLINVVDGERLWACIAGCALLVLFGVTLIRAIPGFRIHKYDGFLLSLVPVLFVYIFFPEDFMGRAIIISIRMQLFVFIIIACCIAYRLPDGRVKQYGSLILFIGFIVLTGYHIDCRQRASVALDEYLSVAKYVKPESVVLPFDFSPTGKDAAGRQIADRNAVFHHAAQYMGTDKPLIILDNYEANMGYFPLRWKPEMNPYNHLSKAAGIEALPPCADIAAYEAYIGKRVDNIIFWCYEPTFVTHPDFAGLYAEINSKYKLIYTAPGGRVVLYARKTD
jgi:hypothetical protein